MWYELVRLGLHRKFPWPPRHICTVESTMQIKGHRLHLANLHEHLFGEKFAGAHRAMVDVEALTRCFIKLVQDGEIVL
jgi:DNA polymerase III epsilon subunit-like protein